MSASEYPGTSESSACYPLLETLALEAVCHFGTLEVSVLSARYWSMHLTQNLVLLYTTSCIHHQTFSIPCTSVFKHSLSWVCPLCRLMFKLILHFTGMMVSYLSSHRLEPLPFWKRASVLLGYLGPSKECTATLSCYPDKKVDKSLASLDCAEIWTVQALVVTFLQKST